MTTAVTARSAENVAATEVLRAELLEELALLQAMPQVAALTAACLFDRGEKPQQRGALVFLTCCKRAGGGLKPIDQKFNTRTDEMACASYSDCLRLLREKVVRDHSSVACLLCAA